MLRCCRWGMSLRLPRSPTLPVMAIWTCGCAGRAGHTEPHRGFWFRAAAACKLVLEEDLGLAVRCCRDVTMRQPHKSPFSLWNLVTGSSVLMKTELALTRKKKCSYAYLIQSRHFLYLKSKIQWHTEVEQQWGAERGSCLLVRWFRC